MGGMNPWVTMWTQPRNTIRTILQTNPRYGILYLAAIYALQEIFYFSNYWSLGIYVRFYTILIAGIILSPAIGFLWLYFSAWILHFTGRWLNGAAPMSHLRAAVAWAKIPTCISLLMWFVLLIAHPDYVFILDAGGPSSIFINFITLILGIWSLVLLIQALREVQFFSTSRALANVVIAWIISTVFISLFIGAIRYLYILTV